MADETVEAAAITLPGLNLERGDLIVAYVFRAGHAEDFEASCNGTPSAAHWATIAQHGRVHGTQAEMRPLLAAKAKADEPVIEVARSLPPGLARP